MKCPNCQLPFTEEKDPKFFCSTCGWLVKVDDKEWQSCDAPESQAPQESPAPQEIPPEPEPEPEPDPAALEPDPAALELQPAAPEPDPKTKVKEYFGGLVTITEVDE